MYPCIPHIGRHWYRCIYTQSKNLMDLREESVPATYPKQLFSPHKSVRNRYIRLRNMFAVSRNWHFIKIGIGYFFYTRYEDTMLIIKCGDTKCLIINIDMVLTKSNEYSSYVTYRQCLLFKRNRYIDKSYAWSCYRYRQIL